MNDDTLNLLKQQERELKNELEALKLSRRIKQLEEQVATAKLLDAEEEDKKRNKEKKADK